MFLVNKPAQLYGRSPPIDVEHVLPVDPVLVPDGGRPAFFWLVALLIVVDGFVGLLFER